MAPEKDQKQFLHLYLMKNIISMEDIMSNFFELIEKRESCRSFSNERPTKDMLMKCIEAARLAPSACNSQPWSFVVINSETLSPQVAKCTQGLGMNKFTEVCPAFIVVCEETAKLSDRISAVVAKQYFAPGDVGLATAHICYSATEQGLSTCILGWFDEKALKGTLKLPKTKRVRYVIAIGYAASDTTLRKKVRKSLDEIVTYID